MKKQVRIRKDRHRKGLAEQIEAPENNGLRVYPRGSAEKKRKRSGEEEASDALTAKLSGRILKVAREQQEEVDEEDARTALNAALGGDAAARLGAGALAAALRRAADSDDEDDESDGDEMMGGDVRMLGSKAISTGAGSGDDDDDDVGLGRNDDVDAELQARMASLQGGGGGGQEEYETGADAEEGVSAEEERALAAFMAPGAATHKQLSLGDLVLNKLREKQKEQGLQVLPEDGMAADEEEEGGVPEGLDDKVVQVYRAVGKLLTRYNVGKLPKAFKIIPNLKNWEEVLWLTNPDGWSPHAMYEATKMFVSNLNARLAQRFLALVLLPRIRWEIKEKQKLHFALFMALKKATYKPGAFYKGILLPLCATRTCTLREAVILTSVLKRTSIPVLHSAAALMRMADMEYCGTTSFFMRVLLDKKYALPYRVIDGLVDHFVRFADDERQMPVVWHQTLLCFVQRYKDEIRPQDQQALRKLCSIQSHYLVTPEVLRELDHARARGQPQAQPGSSWAAGKDAAFTMGAGFSSVLGGAGKAFSGGRAAGAAVFAPVSHVAVIAKNVSENVRSMPPVMMLEDD